MAVAIGFDLGETLLTYVGTPLNWAERYSAALERVAQRCQLQPSAAQIACACEVLARANTRLHPRRPEISAATLFAEILATWKEPDFPAEKAADAFFDFFQQRIRAYPETVTTLIALRARGLSLGILTDVPYGMPRRLVEHDLRQAALTSHIDLLVTSPEVGFRKPSPEGFHALAEKLSVSPRDLWYVGNEEKDIRGARAVGATAVLIDRNEASLAWGQHHTIRRLDELLRLL